VAIADDHVNVRWTGEGAYRSLGYYFTVRWNRARFGTYVHYVLDQFGVAPDPAELQNPPTPGVPPEYSLVDLGPAAPRYRLMYGDRSLIESDHEDDIFHHFFWHVHAETFRRTGSFFLVHAGTVVAPNGRGVVLPGASEAGKTTLVMGLVRAGFGYLSDEVAVIDPVTRRLYPYPKSLSVKEGSWPLFSDLLNGPRKIPRVGDALHVHPDDVRRSAVGAPCDIGFVVFPTFMRGADMGGFPISRAEAVKEVFGNAISTPSYGSRGLVLIADAVREAVCMRLQFATLEGAVNTISTLVSDPPNSPT
jgi:hypothetical protein